MSFRTLSFAIVFAETLMVLVGAIVNDVGNPLTFMLPETLIIVIVASSVWVKVVVLGSRSESPLSHMKKGASFGLVFGALLGVLYIIWAHTIVDSNDYRKSCFLFIGFAGISFGSMCAILGALIFVVSKCLGTKKNK
jgi:hypothetical protein